MLPPVMVPALDDLLAFASDLPADGDRASALVDLVPRLPADRLDAVLDVAFADEHQRTRVMTSVLSRATPAHLARIRSAVGQLTQLWQQYSMLFVLLPHLSEEEQAVVVAKLVATLERRPIFDLPDRVRLLAPRLRPDQMDRLVVVGLRDENRAYFLASVWHHLPDSRLGALVSEVCADPAEYHWVLGTLASRLGDQPLAALLEAAHTIDEDQARNAALADLARYLPEPARSAAIEASVAGVVAAMRRPAKSWVRVLPETLPPQANHDQIGRLLAADRAARGRGTASNFTAIAPYATPSQLCAAIAAAIAPARLGEPLPESAPIALTVDELVKVIPHLPQTLQDSVVRTVLPRFDPSFSRIPHLSADQTAEVLHRLDAQTEPWTVARSIGYLAPFLGEARLDEAMSAVLAIEDETFLGEALINVAPCLSPEHLARALHVATEITDPDTRAYTLVRLAPHLEQPDTVHAAVSAALSAALSVRDPEDRARRLLEVAAVQPADGRAAALGATWAALVTMPQTVGQVVIFDHLVGLLPID
jgi:hypothetical protein